MVQRRAQSGWRSLLRHFRWASHGVRRAAGAYWVPINGSWWQVPEKAIIRNAGNPLGEAVVWYVSLRGNIEIRCFVPADAA